MKFTWIFISVLFVVLAITVTQARGAPKKQEEPKDSAPNSRKENKEQEEKNEPEREAKQGPERAETTPKPKADKNKPESADDSDEDSKEMKELVALLRSNMDTLKKAISKLEEQTEKELSKFFGEEMLIEKTLSKHEERSEKSYVTLGILTIVGLCLIVVILLGLVSTVVYKCVKSWQAKNENEEKIVIVPNPDQTGYQTGYTP